MNKCRNIVLSVARVPTMCLILAIMGCAEPTGPSTDRQPKTDTLVVRSLAEIEFTASFGVELDHGFWRVYGLGEIEYIGKDSLVGVRPHLKLYFSKSRCDNDSVDINIFGNITYRPITFPASQRQPRTTIYPDTTYDWVALSDWFYYDPNGVIYYRLSFTNRVSAGKIEGLVPVEDRRRAASAPIDSPNREGLTSARFTHRPALQLLDQ